MESRCSRCYSGSFGVEQAFPQSKFQRTTIAQDFPLPLTRRRFADCDAVGISGRDGHASISRQVAFYGFTQLPSTKGRVALGR